MEQSERMGAHGCDLRYARPRRLPGGSGLGGLGCCLPSAGAAICPRLAAECMCAHESPNCRGCWSEGAADGQTAVCGWMRCAAPIPSATRAAFTAVQSRPVRVSSRPPTFPFFVSLLRVASPSPPLPLARRLSMCECLADCCLPAAHSGRWTPDSIRQFAATKQPVLPIAEMQPGSVIKISGYHGFFSHAPLINPQWTDGRMSQAE